MSAPQDIDLEAQRPIVAARTQVKSPPLPVPGAWRTFSIRVPSTLHRAPSASASPVPGSTSTAGSRHASSASSASFVSMSSTDEPPAAAPMRDEYAEALSPWLHAYPQLSDTSAQMLGFHAIDNAGEAPVHASPMLPYFLAESEFESYGRYPMGVASNKSELRRLERERDALGIQMSPTGSFDGEESTRSPRSPDMFAMQGTLGGWHGPFTQSSHEEPRTGLLGRTIQRNFARSKDRAQRSFSRPQLQKRTSHPTINVLLGSRTASNERDETAESHDASAQGLGLGHAPSRKSMEFRMPSIHGLRIHKASSSAEQLSGEADGGADDSADKAASLVADDAAEKSGPIKLSKVVEEPEPPLVASMPADTTQAAPADAASVPLRAAPALPSLLAELSPPVGAAPRLPSQTTSDTRRFGSGASFVLSPQTAAQNPWASPPPPLLEPVEALESMSPSEPANDLLPTWPKDAEDEALEAQPMTQASTRVSLPPEALAYLESDRSVPEDAQTFVPLQESPRKGSKVAVDESSFSPVPAEPMVPTRLLRTDASEARDASVVAADDSKRADASLVDESLQLASTPDLGASSPDPVFEQAVSSPVAASEAASDAPYEPASEAPEEVLPLGAWNPPLEALPEASVETSIGSPSASRSALLGRLADAELARPHAQQGEPVRPSTLQDEPRLAPPLLPGTLGALSPPLGRRVSAAPVREYRAESVRATESPWATEPVQTAEPAQATTQATSVPPPLPYVAGTPSLGAPLSTPAPRNPFDVAQDEAVHGHRTAATYASWNPFAALAQPAEAPPAAPDLKELPDRPSEADVSASERSRTRRRISRKPLPKIEVPAAPSADDVSHGDSLAGDTSYGPAQAATARADVSTADDPSAVPDALRAPAPGAVNVSATQADVSADGKGVASEPWHGTPPLSPAELSSQGTTSSKATRRRHSSWNLFGKEPRLPAARGLAPALTRLSSLAQLPRKSSFTRRATPHAEDATRPVRASVDVLRAPAPAPAPRRASIQSDERPSARAADYPCAASVAKPATVVDEAEELDMVDTRGVPLARTEAAPAEDVARPAPAWPVQEEEARWEAVQPAAAPPVAIPMEAAPPWATHAPASVVPTSRSPPADFVATTHEVQPPIDVAHPAPQDDGQPRFLDVSLGDEGNTSLSMLGAVAGRSSGWNFDAYFETSLERIHVPPPASYDAPRVIADVAPRSAFALPQAPAGVTFLPEGGLDEFEYIFDEDAPLRTPALGAPEPPAKDATTVPSLPQLDTFLPEERELMGIAPAPQPSAAAFRPWGESDDATPPSTALPLEFVTKPNSVLSRGRPVKQNKQDATSVFYASLPEKRRYARKVRPADTTTPIKTWNFEDDDVEMTPEPPAGAFEAPPRETGAAPAAEPVVEPAASAAAQPAAEAADFAPRSAADAHKKKKHPATTWWRRKMPKRGPSAPAAPAASDADAPRASTSTTHTIKYGRPTGPPGFEPTQPGKYYLAGTVSLPTLNVARTAEQRARNETGLPETEPMLIQSLLAAPSSSTVRARAGIIKTLPYDENAAPPTGQVLVAEERKILVRPVM